MTNIISNDYAEAILAEIRKEDSSAYLIKRFSGIHMYGAECLAYEVENQNAALEAICRISIAHSDNNLTASDFTQCLQTDFRHGKPVIYFPQIKV